MLGYFRDSFKGDDAFRIDSGNEKRNSEFQFNRNRNMPIASIFGHNGYFLFSSENSFDKFKQTEFKFSSLDPDGVGVPLFHIEHQLGSVICNSPTFMIYKYILQSNEDSPPYSEFKIVKQDSYLCLYKVPFCEIYSRLDLVRTEYELIFQGKQGEPSHLMVRGFSNRDLHSRLNNINLRWHVSFSPLIPSDHYKLLVLDENAPSLLDDPATKKRKKKLNGDSKQDFIIAHYTRKDRDMLLHTVSKKSNLIVGEQSELSAYGITSVPWNTQIIACEGMLIQYLEHYERRRKQRHNINQQNQQNLQFPH